MKKIGIFDDIKRLFKINIINYDGFNEVYDEEGNLIKKFSKNSGKKHGVYNEWYSNSQERKIMNFVHGVLEGEMKEWYETGQLKSKKTFTNGVISSIQKEWYENGKLKLEGVNRCNDYVDDRGFTKIYDFKYQGISKEYHQNGQLMEIGVYNDNEQVGVWKTYHENGQLQSITEYCNNEEIGVTKRFYKNGNLLSEKWNSKNDNEVLNYKKYYFE